MVPREKVRRIRGTSAKHVQRTESFGIINEILEPPSVRIASFWSDVRFFVVPCVCVCMCALAGYEKTLSSWHVAVACVINE